MLYFGQGRTFVCGAISGTQCKTRVESVLNIDRKWFIFQLLYIYAAAKQYKVRIEF